MRAAGARPLLALACLGLGIQAPTGAAAEVAAPAPEPALPEAAATRLDPAVLQEILRSLDLGATADESLLGAAWRWLRERFANQGIDLEHWLDALLQVPDSALQWASRLSMAAMVVLAVVLLANELRHGRMLLRAPRRWPKRGGARTATAPLDWSGLAALPAGEQPGAALRLALAALADRGTAVDAAATHREVLATARRERAAPWRRPLARLTLLAERARFGRWRPSREQGDAAVALGRAVAAAAAR